MDLFRNRRWDLVGKAWLWYTISIAVMLPGLIIWGVKGLNLGIDFTGGAIMKYQFEKPLASAPNGDAGAMSTARKAADEIGYRKNEVQVADQRWLIVRINEFDEQRRRQAQAQLEQKLKELLSPTCGAITQASDVEFVGPVVGEDLKRGAEWALVLGCGGILIYISLRYRFRFAVAGILALLHDVLVLTGVMALLRVEINSPFVATVLTVFGYSINDTVVIFDRIRENQTIHRQAPFETTVNTSLLQTMARSVNTVLTVEITLICLYFFGGASIKPFALSLIVGITSGCYSSIFNASQLMCTWRRMWDHGLGEKLWWRAILGLAPALFIGVPLELIVSKTGLKTVPVLGQYKGYIVAVIAYAVGFLTTKYYSVGALRVLAGIPAARSRIAGAPRPGTFASPTVAAQQRAAAEAAVQASKGLSSETAMHAASAAAAEQEREERRERRKLRKVKEQRRPGERKKRF